MFCTKLWCKSHCGMSVLGCVTILTSYFSQNLQSHSKYVPWLLVKKSTGKKWGAWNRIIMEGKHGSSDWQWKILKPVNISVPLNHFLMFRSALAPCTTRLSMSIPVSSLFKPNENPETSVFNWLSLFIDFSQKVCYECASRILTWLGLSWNAVVAISF